jgi:short-subunit dehydrogenase
MRIRGSTIVVTGASSGIGRDAATRLARSGAKVWAVARSEERLARLAEEHPSVTPFAADVTVGADRAALVKAVGDIDVLVNNAGMATAGLVARTSSEEVRQMFEVNVLGLIDLTQRVLPRMIERRHGHIVNLGSVASWVSVPPLSVYSASKFAVAGFNEGLRRELLGKGVSVGLIAPGPLASEFLPRAGVTNARVLVSLPPVSLAGRAIVRSIRCAGVPGWGTIAVPRIAGLTRLGAVPGIARLADLVTMFTRPEG